MRVAERIPSFESFVLAPLLLIGRLRKRKKRAKTGSEQNEAISFSRNRLEEKAEGCWKMSDETGV